MADHDATTGVTAPPAIAARNVVFYDGVCALCNRSMKLLIRADRGHVLAFAPLQGETFEAFGAKAALEEGLDSIVYVRGLGGDDATTYVRSDAILQSLRDVGGFWRVLSWLRVIPRGVRDWAYDFIAARRYKWFGRYDECRLPTPRQREQLLP